MLDEALWSEVIEGLRALGEISYADLNRDATIEDMAKRLVDHAPGTFVLIGFSMGGYVTREAASLAPDRTLGLIQIATSSRGDTELQAKRKIGIAGSAVIARFGGLSRAAIVSSLAPAHATEPLIEHIREMGERLGGEVFRNQSSLVRVSDKDRLGEIKCPTLIIAADQDQLRSQEEAQELHEGIAGSTLAVIEGSGHMIPLEAPAALLDVIVPWIKRLPGQVA